MTPDTSVYTDFTGLAGLKVRAGQDSPEALRETAKQFESLFTRMLLKSMRDASFGGGILDGPNHEFYQDMFDAQISMELSKGRGLGLAEVLVRQLGGEAHPSVETNAAPTGWQPATPDEFVNGILPHARRAAEQLGVPVEGIVAQAALETGWGRSLMRSADGQPANNVFGIKAGRGWTGPSVALNTLEFADGVAVQKREQFRAYGSVEAGFEDYVSLLKTSSRYAGVLSESATPEEFASAIADAGYATDPRYAQKIRAVLNSDALRGLRESSSAPEHRNEL